MSKIITANDIIQFAEITGDKNPIHLDDDYASNTRFKKRIAHGMFLGGLISAALGTKIPGPGAIYISQTFNFLAPVFIGDSVEILVEVVSIRDDKPVVTIKTECKNQNGKIVLEGEAILLATK